MVFTDIELSYLIKKMTSELPEEEAVSILEKLNRERELKAAFGLIDLEENETTRSSIR
jgi:hypothetical protein